MTPKLLKPHIKLFTGGTALITVRWRLLRDTEDIHDWETVMLAKNFGMLLDRLVKLGCTPKQHPSLLSWPPLSTRFYQESGPKFGHWFCEINLPNKEPKQ